MGKAYDLRPQELLLIIYFILKIQTVKDLSNESKRTYNAVVKDDE